MRTDFFCDSVGGGQLHGCRWTPEGDVKAVVQIVHGIAEFVERYDEFARYLNGMGILVVAEDHMGHGQSISEAAPQGFFNGGWMAAVEDTYGVLRRTRAEFPEIPYVLFGHSMGSFMARTLLAKYPDSGIAAAIICGTGWQPEVLLKVGSAATKAACKVIGEKTPSKALNDLVFGAYNKRVEHPKTAYDWISRDAKLVEEYVAHPLCGFIPTAGLMRDMMEGLTFIQKHDNLVQMKKELPVLFVAGGDDPVGNYGPGVEKTAEEFRKIGMAHVDLKLFPLCRHEILNEINRQEVFNFLGSWIEKVI